MFSIFWKQEELHLDPWSLWGSELPFKLKKVTSCFVLNKTKSKVFKSFKEHYVGQGSPRGLDLVSTAAAVPRPFLGLIILRLTPLPPIFPILALFNPLHISPTPLLGLTMAGGCLVSSGVWTSPLTTCRDSWQHSPVCDICDSLNALYVPRMHHLAVSLKDRIGPLVTTKSHCNKWNFKIPCVLLNYV